MTPNQGLTECFKKLHDDGLYITAKQPPGALNIVTLKCYAFSEKPVKARIIIASVNLKADEACCGLTWISSFFDGYCSTPMSKKVIAPFWESLQFLDGRFLRRKAMAVLNEKNQNWTLSSLISKEGGWKVLEKWQGNYNTPLATIKLDTPPEFASSEVNPSPWINNPWGTEYDGIYLASIDLVSTKLPTFKK